MHYYLNNRRMTPEDLPPTKAGKSRKRMDYKLAEEAGGVPGVTDYLNFVGDAGGLINWSMNIGVEAAIKVFDEDVDLDRLGNSQVWKGLAKAKGNELREEAAKEGTRIHEAVDGYLSGKIGLADDPVASTAQQQVSEMIQTLGLEGEKEYCFSNDVYGGTVDFLDEGRLYILDWKSVDGDNPRDAKITDLAQLCAYARHFFDSTTVKMANVYLSRKTGEILDTRWWNQDEQQTGWDLFDLAVRVRRMYREFK